MRGERVARATALALALLVSNGPPAAAQAPDDGARMERVAPGVYVIIHDNATDEWPHGNTGVVVGDDGVFVLDATYLPSRARADIALIKSVTPKPVRYLAYTHWHFDHNNGAVAYRDAWPGVTIVSERQTRDFITLNVTYWSKMSTAAGSARRASLAALEAEVRTGKDSAGTALTADDRRRKEIYARQRKGELDELASLTVVAPTLVFDNELTLHLGGRTLVLHDWGRANSPHDVTLLLPEDRVLFAGDIVVQSPLPFVGASNPVPWIETLRRIEMMPLATLVPGHGPVMHDHIYTRQVRALLEAATSRVTAMALQGKTLDQVQDSLTLADIRAATPAWRNASNDEDWRLTVRTLLERAWRGVRGQS
jgi:glyoxylase-like metal-dependent hydrolase (beta-lactamase superfamily II)